MSAEAGRILGVDYGSKRVGVSISDPLRVIASGVATLANDETLLLRLGELVRKQEVVKIVVGMPYSADGGKGAKAREVDAFIDRLQMVVDVPIDTWDESYSSVRAHEVFIETGMRKKKRQEKARVDEMAARLMLQEYLQNHGGHRHSV